ncbi:MAG: cytidine deaminase [Clostridia bacterium]|nr:cytidine deaminase [Clostridia bacterium]
MAEINYDEMIKLAAKAMGESYSPYSKCRVGACLLGESGQYYLGCNVENASYSATCCAERTAIFKAVSSGEKKFRAIAVVGGFDGNIKEYFPPCGVCRQVMSEFCKDGFEVILFNGKERKVLSMEDVLPYPFGSEKLK